MRKNLKKIIIAAVAVVVLVGSYFALKLSPDQNAGGETGSGTGGQQLVVADDAIASAHIVNAKGEVTIRKSESRTWKVDELEGYDTDYDQITAAITSLENMAATQVVQEQADDLAEYGLDKPSATVEVTFGDGASYTYELGNASPLGDGYYLKEKDKNKVYLTSTDVGKVMLGSLTTLVSRQIIPANDKLAEADIEHMELAGNARQGEEIVIEAASYTGAENEVEMYSHRIVSPRSRLLDSEYLQSVLEFFKNCKADDVAEIAPDLEGLEVYGLTAPSYIVKVTIDKQEYELWFGNTSAYGQTAVMLKGRDVVYLMSNENLDFVSANFDEVANTIMLMPFIDTLDTVVVNYEGQSYEFKLTGERTNLAVTYNGKEMDIEAFRVVYRNIIAFKKEEAADKPAGEPYLTITLSYRGVESKDVIKFTEIDARRSFYELNDIGDFYVLNATVDDFIDLLSRFINGEQISAKE